MKQIEVHILQQSYLLTCPEGQEARLLEAVTRLDTAMTRIRDAGKVRARERIAVLAALNLAFEGAEPQTQATAQPMPADGETTSDQDERLVQLIKRLDAALQEGAAALPG